MTGAVASLPGVLAVIGVDDRGPSDGTGSANCPHCGASGRYVIRFVCDDGTTRAAMRGCFKLFGESQSLTAQLTQEAFRRSDDARLGRRPLATWWAAILEAVEKMQRDHDVPAFRAAVQASEQRRQSWLRANGYGRRRRR